MPVSFALVIPTLREAPNMAALLPAVRASLDSTGLSYEVIVADDHSGDGIAQAVEDAVGGDRRFRVLSRTGSRGLTGAVLMGWRDTEAQWLGVMDADGQHPATIWPAMLAQLAAGADVVIGSRYTRGGSTLGWSSVRLLTSRVAVAAVRPLLRGRGNITDPMAGLVAVRRQVLEGIRWQEKGFKLLLQILTEGRVERIAEVPIVFGLRVAGESKLGWHSTFADLKTLLSLYRRRA